MKKWILALLSSLSLGFMSSATAAGDTIELQKAPIDLHDKASLQRGATLFMNYCLGCHSTQYQRYQRVARDLGIPDEIMTQNLIFSPAIKITDPIKTSMPQKWANLWFGAAPPDLTLVSRVRSPDWIYTYLKSFYADPSRPFGVNNLLFPNVGMPHVLEPLQGTPSPIFANEQIDGQHQTVVIGTKSNGRGELNQEEYDKAVTDIANFLEYSAEPFKLERERLGWWVMGFIFIFFVLALLLKKEYWRDVH